VLKYRLVSLLATLLVVLALPLTASAVSENDCATGSAYDVGCAYVSLSYDAVTDTIWLKGQTWDMSSSTAYTNYADRQMWKDGNNFWHDGRKSCIGCTYLLFPDLPFDCDPGLYTAETEGERYIFRVDADVTLWAP